MYIIFDTETTGKPKDWNKSFTDTDNWPRMVQIAWQLHDYSGKLINRGNKIVYPDGYDIPYVVEQIHGISTAIAKEKGEPLEDVLNAFGEDLAQAECIVGHNIEFDRNIVGSECVRNGLEPEVAIKSALDTMKLSTNFCAIPGGRGGKYKWPSLTELHKKLFGKGFGDAHDAAYDVDATAKCFFGLLSHGVIKTQNGIDKAKIHYEAPKLEQANFALKSNTKDETTAISPIPNIHDAVDPALQAAPFIHLHCRSQYSVLQSTTDLGSLVQCTVDQGAKAIAMVDNANLYGAFSFVKEAESKGIHPIIGIEINVCEDHLDKKTKDDGYPVVLLAKNKEGYKNLVKISSIAFTDGFYYVPRIDKKVLMKYRENLIALSGSLWGEVPSKILNQGVKQAENSFLWWKKTFGDDFYAELQRHGLPEEDIVNKELIALCQKYDVAYVATNNSYYTHQENANAHDILLCVKDAENQSTPSKFYGSKGRDHRFGLPNEEFYIKSPDEMKRLFADLPDAILNVQGLYEKIEPFSLQQEILLPKYTIPEAFQDPEDEKDGGKRGENAYLRHITLEGAKKRYGTLSPDIQERLDFELSVIAQSGYPGYFLIVEDFIRVARSMGVSVGPGRGSAAGSAVAYCVGITNVDPIAYDLLFERFLNPERVSMPDIDIDFDDEGRQKVIDYVIETYGSNKVAQIITYGSMAAKSAIRDAARVMELPLAEADKLAKLIPTNISLKKIFSLDEKELKKAIVKDEEFQNAKALIKIAKGNNLQAEIVKQAQLLEGSVRNVGIHACGIIITPDDLTDFVPVAKAKDSEMFCTQFDNACVEDAGLLKMDFLGLKTLTLIKVAIEIIKDRHGTQIVADDIPLDDEATYKLFQRGETNGVFQYESPGMQKHLKSLKPTKFEDLIAMNALYRPGPMEYIPSFIKRKHGQEKIEYDLEDCKEHLEETYGITVYQEQVMLLSQKLADFTKGEADVLRKAMGKKKRDILEKLKPKFLNQGEARGHNKQVLEKIWKDWEAFASYAFNKSHSTCYAYVAFHTAYLKANYPAEYMASVLSNNLNDIKKVTFYMEECRALGIQVLSPDVNESNYQFSVNQEGNIRFGMGAIKGVGRSAIESIVAERQTNGRYLDIYDFFSRTDYKSVNKKALESLCLAGAFDCFDTIHRAQLIEADDSGKNALELLSRFGQAVQQSADAPPDLFGDSSDTLISSPTLPQVKEWSDLYKLKQEREVVGFYITGHPLDLYAYEIENFVTGSTTMLKDIDSLKKSDLKLAGTISKVIERIDKKGNPFGRFTLEDYDGHHEFMLFGPDYIKHKNALVDGAMVMLSGRLQERYFGGSKEFKIEDITLLAEILEKICKKLEVSIALADISNALVDQVKSILRPGVGKVQVRLTVHDDDGMQCTLKSEQSNYQLNSEKLKQLEKLPELHLRLM